MPADGIPERERVYFGTREQAERAGYTVAAVAECAPNGISGGGDPSGLDTVASPQAARVSVAPDRPLPDASLASQARACRIERVIDGDTVVCEGGERVRLLMIDTPEADQAPYGALATAALEELIRGRFTVRLEFDVQRQDQYGRTLAYLWLDDGRMVNEEMARSGYAVALVYPPNVRYDERIRAAVADARQAQRGLWATEAFQCLPVDHRAGRC